MNLSARTGGALKVLAGLVIYVSVWLWVFNQGGFGDSRGGTFYIVTMGVPGALLLIGVVELITNAPFVHLASRWDELKPWKRGVYGTLIVVAAIVLIFGSLLLYGWVRDG